MGAGVKEPLVRCDHGGLPDSVDVACTHPSSHAPVSIHYPSHWPLEEDCTMGSGGADKAAHLSMDGHFGRRGDLAAASVFLRILHALSKEVHRCSGG